ncbi:hypothetical protein SARC_05940 [Sphaeroforma arctica JP610]|uniref:BAH domain-containing protein n=1 Tax=Sphaeroforma arctica JP610 TaxID=667725 RepID=A0A0L0FYW9_9EUKA|nr:hypothetical protein SARC_05940 [Sphaeroforma arctica JP610]KNC81756.1 hypothetical protein SARC_05940 [Sphaeroforma arctica JP610]|eukprot:XP_014155658.1 hypothetical protein SARC_05940 [Sphaeroforma arctica JP610]
MADATVVFEQVRSTIRDHGDKIQEIMYGVWTGAEPETDSPSNETAAIDNTEIASSENTENAATSTTVKDENKPGYILRNGTDTSVTDVIQCVCQLNVNEGCMLQCSGCLVWLHDTCVQLTPEQAADDSFDFVCAECLQVSPSEFLVVPNEYTDDDEERHNTYYRYLVRDGTHYRQGLCVYVPVNTHKRSSSRTAHQNIIRIAQIWTTPDGQAYVSGSRHYRPWETRHKINHRFGKQEVVKSNTTIVAKVDDLLGCCAVMSTKDYIEGKVYDIAERDTYYVEWRYDPDYAQWKKIRKHDFAEHHTDLCNYVYRATPADTTRYILNGSEFVEPPASTKSKGKSSPNRGNGDKANDALRPKKGPAKVSNANVNTHTSKRGASREGRSGSSVPETGTAPDTTTNEGVMANKIVGCTTAVGYTTAERGAAHMSHDDKKEAMESILDSLALEVDEDIRKVSVDVSFLLVGSRRRCGNRS